MIEEKYNHVEAFAIMTYQCEKCRKTEKLWNSRDGVTPFIIICKHCGGEANHINWECDKQVPNFTPPKGMRVFIDMPESIKPVLARKRIESAVLSRFAVPVDEVEETIVKIVKSFDAGTPYIIKL